jgi:hypothetical protein
VRSIERWTRRAGTLAVRGGASGLSVSSGANGFIGGALVLGSAIVALVAAFLWSRGRQQLGWQGVKGTIRAASAHVVFRKRFTTKHATHA